jgi:hypothetical protein
MPINNGTVTIGWDSIGSSVDEFELKRRQPRHPGADRLNDIARIVSHAKRDISNLSRIVGKYSLAIDVFDAPISDITEQALDTVRDLA